MSSSAKVQGIDEGIKLSRYRFRGTPTRLVETGSLKPDQSLQSIQSTPLPDPPPLFFPSCPSWPGSFINARPMEFPPRTFHLPFSAPFYPSTQPLVNFGACDERFGIAKYSANIRTDKLSNSVKLFQSRNTLSGMETSVRDACVST